MERQLETARAANAGSLFIKSQPNYTIKNSALSVEAQFREAMQSAGITYHGAIIADGQLHRFYIEGDKAGSKNGYYKLHLDGTPAGIFGSWKLGVTQLWRQDGTKAKLSQADIASIKAAQLARQKEIEATHQLAASNAAHIWSTAQPAVCHNYLITKRIKPHGARVGICGALLVPVFDGDKLSSIQFISPDGDKRFLAGGKVSGCFYQIGAIEEKSKLLICEGFGTGASIYEVTGNPTIIAFNAHNLTPVAKKIRSLYPSHEIIVMGDNDVSGVGQAAAKAAALACRGRYLVPRTVGFDWNDAINEAGAA